MAKGKQGGQRKKQGNDQAAAAPAPGQPGGFWSFVSSAHVWGFFGKVLDAVKVDPSLAALWGFGVLLLLVLIAALFLGSLTPGMQLTTVLVIVAVLGGLFVYTVPRLPRAERAKRYGVSPTNIDRFSALIRLEQIPPEREEHELARMADAYHRDQLLEQQAHRLNVRAVELIREGKVDRAREELADGERLLLALVKDRPGDVSLDIQRGYFHKTMAQAYDAVGDNKKADRELEAARASLSRVAGATAASRLSLTDRVNLSNSLNLLANLYFQRGEPEKAAQLSQRAVDFLDDNVYAWHDLFLALDELAKRGKADLPAMRHALQKVKEKSQGQPGLDAGYIAQLEQVLHDREAEVNQPL
jgi:tetratricopeptide (TPR) repeat protein